MSSLMRYIRVVIRRRFLVLSIIAATLVGGLIATLLTKSKYTSNSTLEISRQEDKVLKVDAVERETSAIDQEFYQTQYSLLQANSLALSVARELRLPQSDSFFAMFGVQPDSKGIWSFGNAPSSTEQKLANRERLATEILLRNLNVAPVRQSRLVRVGFTSPDARFSQKVVQFWAQQFIQSNLNRRFESTAYARNFLEGRLDELRKRLEQSERALVDYASKQRIINIPNSEPTAGGGTTRSERSLTADDLVSLSKELSAATADRIRAESRIGPGVRSESRDNIAINALRQKRSEAAAEYARLMQQFEPGYPAARAIAAQMQDLDRSIATEERRVRLTLEEEFRDAAQREQALSKKVEDLKNSFLSARTRSIEYNIYQRDIDTSRELYDGLLQRYKEIGVAGAIGPNNIAVVDAANLPDKRSSPNLLINMILALVIGFGTALAVVAILEQIDDAIKDPADVEAVLELPLLGVVPAIPEQPLEALRDRKSALSEAYLSIQTNLQLSTSHGMPRSIAVTSTRPAEGKTTTTLALAVMLARTGRTVVVVDCDMRSPSLHGFFGLANTVGVSNFLAGQDDVEPLLHRIGDFQLTAMLAGPQPPNAAELLTGPRLDQLIEKLNARFDHVLIDAPPVMGLADAPLIGSHTEAMLFAVEANGARSTVIRSAVSRLSAGQINLVGAILTKFEARKALYGYGYDYGYGYGYSYGGASKDKA